MNKLSKYFSLFKYSLSNPKNGLNLLNEARQSRHDNQPVQKHQIEPIFLEECLKKFFPSHEISREKLIQNTRKLETYFYNYFENLKDIEFPSKKKPYPIDYSIRNDSCLFLYGLCRILKPDVIVETGVAYGLSSSYILKALQENGKGILYSIDGTFRPWESSDMIGNAIPSELRNQWKLVLGSSSEKLIEVLNSLEKIDIFLHDSLHTYENMSYEFETSWPYLTKNGFLLSDDLIENNAFHDFYSTNELTPVLIKDKKDNNTTFGILRKH